MNVTSKEAELFAIRSGIAKALKIPNIKHIAIFTDSLYVTRHAIDPSLYHNQSQMVTFSLFIRKSFEISPNNKIKFWDMPKKIKWPSHTLVDKESKNISKWPLLSRKNSWVFSKKEKCNSIWRTWQQYFQASDKKGNHFLELRDDNNHALILIYANGGTWLKHIGKNNFLCARLTRLITNHTPIGEYYQYFFLDKNSLCPCNIHTIESRTVTNFIWPYLHKYLYYSHSLGCIWKPSGRPFKWCPKHVEVSQTSFGQ